MFKTIVLVLASLFILIPPAQAQDGQSRDLIAKYWPGDDDQALSVAWCESRFDERAQNSCCRGVFQLHHTHHRRAEALGYTWEDMYDAGKNTRVAYSLWKDQGWGPWECRP